MRETFYITTPIYYPSDNLHIGHAYCTVAADAVARYKRMRGFDVMFLTGTDEHGQKIERRAAEEGVSPKEYVDNIVSGIKVLWERLNISYDRYIRTTDEHHKSSVSKIFERLYEKGDIYKSEYEGLYCSPCESFWNERQLVDGNCPDCGRPVERTKEESYFFKLSSYQKKLEELYAANPDFISPQSRLNEMLNNFIKPGLEDLCVSRTSLKWGIPVSFEPSHVIYVWIDALSNYITALGYGSKDETDYKKYWPADVHLVGKEIVRFHTIIWPAILMALGETVPKKIFGHGWLTLDGGKMSKSKGNVVDPVALCDLYGADAIRYFLLREVPFGSDGAFSNEALINRINNDLANDLGNLVSRSVAMGEKYFGGDIKGAMEEGPEDEPLRLLAVQTAAAYENNMEQMLFSNALSEIWKLISRGNKYIDETMPWILAKEEKTERLRAVLYNLCEVIRVCAVMLQPVMPDTCAEIFVQLGITSEGKKSFESAADLSACGEFKVKKTGNLFPRIDLKKEEERLLQKAEEIKKPPKAAEKKDGSEAAGLISIDDFKKVSLKAARVLSCEAVPKSDKLLKLELDVGDGERRQVVSGIAQWYAPADLEGRTVIIVYNLAPAKLRGILSEGMILAADTASDAASVVFLDGVEPGSVVR